MRGPGHHPGGPHRGGHRPPPPPMFRHRHHHGPPRGCCGCFVFVLPILVLLSSALIFLFSMIF